MNDFTVDLMTADGVVAYPSYSPESVSMDDDGNIAPVVFTPFDGVGSVSITGVRLKNNETETLLPVAFLLSLAVVVRFDVGKLSETAAEPILLEGDPPPSLVRMRQMLLELMEADAGYATQSMPELSGDYTVIHQLDCDQQDDYSSTALIGDYRVYDYDCTARVLVIRGGGSAQQFLTSFKSLLAARRGYYWQCEHEFDVVRSEAIENAPVLVNNLTYQQQAQAVFTVSFSYRASEREGWITWAEVDDALTHVTLTIEGE